MSRVGQFLGKLFSGQAGKNEAALRAYGKLPFYAEYRRLDLAPGTPTAFSQWMDAGRLAWARSVPSSTAGSVYTSRLLIRLPQTREVVVASVWDSRDSLGRAFPFVFFVVCPLGALGNDPFQCWAAAFAIQATFENFHRELAVLGRGGDFYRHYQKRSVVLRPDDLAQRTKRLQYDAGTIAADEWFKAALRNVDAAEWFSGLLRRAQRWKSQPGSVSELALSVPLAHGISSEAQALLWLSWIAEFIRKAGKSAWLVAPAEQDLGRAALHILVRDLLPNDFQLLTTDAGHYGYVENLAQVPQAGSSPADPSPVSSPADSSPPDSSAADSSAPDSPADTPPTGSLLEWLTEHAP